MCVAPRRIHAELRACLAVLLAAATAAGCGGAVKPHHAANAGGLRALFAAPGVLHFEGAPVGGDDRYDWNEYWLDLSTGHWRGVDETPMPSERDDAGNCGIVGDPTMANMDVYLGGDPDPLYQKDVAPLIAGAARHPHRRVLDGRVELGLAASGALATVTYRVRRPGHHFTERFQVRNVARLPATDDNLALTRLATPGNRCTTY